MTDKKLDEMLMQALICDISDDEITVDFGKRKESEKMMKKWNMKKVAAAAALAVLLTGTTAFAASKVSYLVTSAMPNEYTEFKDLSKAEKKTGYRVDALEAFSNGYSFDSISVMNTAGIDENNNKMMEYKELDITYKNANGNRITLYSANTEDYREPKNEVTPDKTRIIADIPVTFTVYRQKVVPDNYEMTPEEKKLSEQGKLWLSCDGTDEISEYDVAVVEWEKDGIAYKLYDMQYSESSDTLIGMAEELIESAR